MYSAYFDRVANNGHAVLLVESMNQDFLFPTSSLPKGSEPGNWFLVEIQNDTITSIQFDEKKTNKMEKNIQDRLKRLQSKKKSKFKRR